MAGPENINHYGFFRYRVKGSGELQSSVKDLAGNIKTLPNVTMIDPERKEPTRIVNFISQRAQLRIETSVINDKMTIFRIIVFVKQIYETFPQ